MCPRRKLDARELLALAMDTAFVLDEAGRVLYENAPDRSAAPRICLAGCATGNALRIRADVSQATASVLEALAADEPPLSAPRSTPVHQEAYIRLLDAEAPVAHVGHGLRWYVAEAFTYAHQVPLVGSDSPAGERLLARLWENGMPRALSDLGFVDPDEFWPPWCVALVDG